MYPTSDRFKDVIRGSYRKIVRAYLLNTVQFGATPEGGIPLPLKAGKVSYNSTADIKSTLDCEVPGDYWDSLKPYGVEIFVERGVDFGDGTTETVPLGYFRVDDIDQPRAPFGTVTVKAPDRMAQLIDARLIYPYNYPAGIAHSVLFDRLVNAYYDGTNQVSYGMYPTRALMPIEYIGYDATRIFFDSPGMVEDNVYEFITDVIKGRGCVLRFSREGRLQIVKRDLGPDTEPAFTVQPGKDGNLVQASRSLTRRGVRNMIAVRGSEPQYPTGYRLAWQGESSHPLYIFGPFGVVPRYFSSPLIVNSEQGDAAAETILSQYKGLPSGLSTVIVPDPSVDILDPMRVILGEGLSEDHIADEVEIPLTGDSNGVTIVTRALNEVPESGGEGEIPGEPGDGGTGSPGGPPIYEAKFLDQAEFPNFTEPASQTVVNVANAGAFATALAAAAPGQTLVLADGTYNVGNVAISKVGTKAQPIVIRAANVGGVKLATGNTITITGKFILVKGINKEFDDSGNAFVLNGSAQFSGFDSCLVGPASLGAAEPTAAKSIHYYVGGSAKDCFITFCESRNKSKPGNGILVDGAGSVLCSHILIDHCYIHDYGTEVVNEFEAIRYGVSTMQTQQANGAIIRCVFERVKTEPEIITVKGSKIASWGHTVRECIGSLSMRHGNDNFMADCYSFGAATGSGGTKSGGHRLYGLRNKVQYCYWEGLNGTSYESTLSIDGGDTTAVNNSHMAIDGGEFTNNMGVNCATGIVVGEHYTIAPKNVKIRDNDFANCGGSAVRNVKAPTGTNDIGNNNHFATTAAAAFTGPTNGAYRKTGRGPRLALLAAADVGPTGNRSDGTGVSISGASGGQSGGVAARVQAAQAILDRMRSGLGIATNWTWSGNPAVVTAEAPNLRSLYAADGSPGDQQKWLQDYITANTGGAGGTATSVAKLLNIGPNPGETPVNVGIGFAAGDVPQPNPENAPANTAEHIDYDMTYLGNGLSIPGYFELTADKLWARLTVTGKGGRTSNNTKYDRVEFRGLKSNGQKQALNPKLTGPPAFSYVKGRVMRMPTNKPELVVNQWHDADDDTIMIRFRNKTTVEAKLGDLVLGNLTTNYTLGTVFQCMIKVTGTGSNTNVEWYWSQGTAPLPTSGAGYFKRTNAGLGDGQYMKAGDYGQSRVAGFETGSNVGSENPDLVPLFVVDMQKLIFWSQGMPEPKTVIG